MNDGTVLATWDWQIVLGSRSISMGRPVQKRCYIELLSQQQVAAKRRSDDCCAGLGSLCELRDRIEIASSPDRGGGGAAERTGAGAVLDESDVRLLQPHAAAR
jgi:hypothetical protein